MTIKFADLNKPPIYTMHLPIFYAVAQLVEALRSKSEGRGFDSPMVSLEFLIDIILSAAL